MKRSALKRKSRLRPVSKKQAVRLQEYHFGRRRYLLENRVCEVCLGALSVDVHHKAGRGENLNDEETWMAVCRHCHDWIHQHPDEARKHGYLI